MSTNRIPQNSNVQTGENEVNVVIPEYTFNTSDIYNDNIITNTELLQELQNYVSEIGGSTLVGDLTVGSNAGIVFEYSNDRQIRAFSEVNYETLNNVENKTQYITIDNGVTKLPSLNITGSLTLETNLPANKIGNGNVNDQKLSVLSDIDIASTIENRLQTINSNVTSNTSNIATNTNNITSLQAYDTSNNFIINNIQNNITSLQAYDTSNNFIINNIQNNITSLQNYDTSNNFIISSIQNNISALQNYDTSNNFIINNIQNDVTSLETNKADVTTVDTLSEKLTDISYATGITTIANDLHVESVVVNNSLQLDGTFIISNNNYQITDQQFSYLKDIDSNVKTSLVNLAIDISGNTTAISNINSTLSTHTTDISNLQADVSANSTDITDLLTDVATNTTDISNLQTTVSSHATTIGSHTTSLSTINSTLTGLENNKQPILNSSNRLNANLIADGSITNLEFQTLYDIDTSQSIQHQIDTINTTLENLDGLQDLDITNIGNIQNTLIDMSGNIATLNTFQSNQTTTNTNVSTSISNLDTNKQNVLSGSNKLNPAYIDAGSGTLSATKMQYLSTITSDVQSQIDSLSSSQGSTYNSSNMLSASYVSSTYGVQNMNVDDALADLRTAVDYNYNQIIDTGNSKQNVIDATHQVSMHYIETTVGNTLYDYITQNDTDISDINTTLSGKQDTITDGSLTIARTSGLQSALDGKYDIPSNASNLAYVDISGNLLSLLNAKQNVINDNDLSIAKTNGLQSALDGKYDIPSNSSNLAYVDISGNLLTLLSEKQNVINDDDLSISKVNGLQSALDGKWNTPLNATALGFVNIGTSLTGLLSEKQSTISNIGYFDATSSIQTQLNSKQATIDTSNRLASTLISTNVNSSASVLSNVLQSLTDVNTNQSTLINTANDDITDLSNTISGHTTSISTINTNISNLQSADIIHDSQITSLQTDMSGCLANISSLQSYNTTNSTTISKIQSDLVDISGNLTTLQNNIDLKQNLIDASANKIPSSYIDYSASPLRFVDISGNLQTQLNSINGQISTLTTLQNGDIANFEAIDQNFTDVNSAIGLKQDIISSSNYLNANLIGTGEVTNTKFNYLKNVTGDIQAQINGLGGGGGGSGYASIIYDGSGNTTISDKTILSTLQFSGDSSQQTTAFTDSKNTDLSNIKTKTTNLSYDGSGNTTISNTLIANGLQSTVIDTINSTLSTLDSTKQNLLNSTTNKLDGSYLNAGSGSMTNEKLQYLSSIASDLATSLNAINSAITALQSFDTSQTTLNSGYASDISALYSGKQNLLDSSANRLNPAFINAGTGTLDSTKMQYLSSIGGDIADALSGKWNTPSNASNLQYVDISGNLTTLLNAKQATITDGSLTIARTSGLQTALDAKANKAGETYTGSHNFAGATVSGLSLTSLEYKVTIKGTYSSGTGNQTIATGEMNGIYVMCMGANRTVTLPSFSGLNDGTWVTIVNKPATTASTMTVNDNNNNLVASVGSPNTVYGKSFTVVKATVSGTSKWLVIAT
jgi:hypothetical protein